MDKPGTLDRLCHISIQCHDLVRLCVRFKTDVQLKSGLAKLMVRNSNSTPLLLTDICQIIQETGGADRTTVVNGSLVSRL